MVVPKFDTSNNLKNPPTVFFLYKHLMCCNRFFTTQAKMLKKERHQPQRMRLMFSIGT
jgi:hypothetical protein